MITGTPRRFLEPAPPEKLAALRILVVLFGLVYLVVRLPHLMDLARLADSVPDRFAPVGPLMLLDGPPSRALVQVVLAATLASGVAGLVGWRWRITGPVFAAGVLCLLSFSSSWGQIFHTENLLVIHLAILAFSPAADVWALDAQRTPPSAAPRYGWPAQLMVLAVVVAYLLAGWAKIRASGIAWAEGDVLANLVAHDALRKDLVGSSSSPFAALVLEWRWLFTPMAVGSLLVELGAPVALLGGRWRAGWALAAVVFHLGVVMIMGILFPYQLLGVAFAAFITIEKIPSRWGIRRGGRAILTT